MALAFLTDLLSRQGNQVPSALAYTPYDELIVIDLETGQFESRYHADGKFFLPVNGGVFQSLVDYAASKLIHPEEKDAFLALLNLSDLESRLAHADPAGVLVRDFRLLALNGEWHEMELLLISGPEFGLPDHIVYCYLFDIRDITAREQGRFSDTSLPPQQLLSRMPDQLTESAFFAQVQERLNRPDNGRWCFVAIDIKHFKLFKELNGQDKGELLLIRFAEILHAAARDTGGLSCYRGQDDYALYCPFDRPRIDSLFSNLCHAIDSLSGVSGFFPVLGIAPIDEDNSVAALDLFNQAALTAEEIKDDLQYHIRVYDPKVHERHVEEFRLVSEFNTALKNGEITFYLQPQCRVSTGKIVGAESLARWRRADGAFVSPVLFVPVLEKYGIIAELDQFIWDSVCAWLRRVIDQGIYPVPVSVNVSRIDMFATDVAAFISELTEKYCLPVGLLKIEITESAYVDDSEQVRNTISALRAKGFQVMMDDFGSGYSSLNMLRSTEMDVIKLDAQFLHFKAGEEQKGINILESVINMTQSLSTPIIVEGVDTRELVLYLTDMGCRYMQGFYFYRPMPCGQFEELLRNPDRIDHSGICRPIHEQMHIREFLDDSIYSDAMLNNILGPVVFYGVSGDNVDIVRFNQQFFRLLHLEPEQLEARRYHIQDYICPEDLSSFLQLFRDAKENRISGESGLVRVFNPDGSTFWMQLHVYYLREENGASLYYGAARDMTELLYINTDLPGGYIRCRDNDSFEFLYISEGFQRMFGFQESEIRMRFGNKLLNMIYPEDREMVIRESREQRSGALRGLSPYRVLHQDGHYRYVLDQSSYTNRFGEPCFQSVLSDVTEVMRLRNRMRVLEKFSTNCIVFLRNVDDPATSEVVVYGLRDVLHVDRDAFQEHLASGRLSITASDGTELADKIRHPGCELASLNGRYTVRVPEGGSGMMHVRFSTFRDDVSGLSCIFTLTPATVS